MEPLGVLVLGVGGNVSQGILKALALCKLPVRVVGACISPLSLGLYTVDRAYVSPLANDPAFVDWLIATCRAEGVRAVLSGVEPVLAVLSRHEARIRAESGAVCVVAPPNVLAIGDDKLETCRWLLAQGFHAPRCSDATDHDGLEKLVADCGLPLLAKPRAGKSAQGVIEIRDRGALALVAGRPGYVVQELLGDARSEFTAGCFTDRDGRLRGTITMRRDLLEGTTYRAVAGAFPEVRHEAERIAAALNPMGPCNVQMRVSQGRPVCFEINVRFSGTTPVRARLGFNDVEAALRHYVLEEPAVDLPVVTEGIALRYWNEVYVDPAAHKELVRAGRLVRPRDYPITVEDFGARWMRVLVTGASGHVGGAIARHLVQAGDEVIGLSRRRSKVAGLAGAAELDLASETAADQVADQVPSCAAIVHAAASLERGLDAPAIALANVLGTQQIVRLAKRWGGAQIVFISSVPVIGRPRDWPVTEAHPTDPPTAYHASKLFGETLMRLAGREGVITASLRLTSPVGPGMAADRILSVFVRRALGGEPLLLAGRGTRRQDYVDVRDVAAAVASCLRERAAGLFNIAAGQSTSNLELAEKCRRLLGSSSEIRFTGVDDPDEGVNWDVSITEARRRFAYRPQFTLDHSILAVADDHAHGIDR